MTMRLKAPAGAGTISGAGYRVVRGRYEHVLIAEAALGRALPKGAEIHHVDEVKTNNSPGNLVICPSKAYHRLLHQRTSAFEASGNANWRKCSACKQYDDPANLYIHRKLCFHRKCANEARKEKHAS